MSSSHQVSPLSHSDSDDYQLTPLAIDTIKVAKIDKLQDRFPQLNNTKENRFVRTRIDFPSPIHAPSQLLNVVNALAPPTKRDLISTTTTSPHTADASSSDTYISYNKYVSDEEVVLLDIVRGGDNRRNAIAFPRAGPRRNIPIHPHPIRAAIVCSGSLCPGQNDVIAEIFNCLYYNYGVDTIYGIHGGFRGFYSPEQQPWDVLTPKQINDCVGQGGSILGSNRGGFDVEKIVNACQVYCVSQLYLIGGDGSHLAASAIDRYCKQHSILLSTACVPCSIENDLAVIDNSFGFGSALSGALDAIQSAVTESRCAPNGIGIVAVTGKHSGYLACHSVLASSNVCACLIPEAPFSLYGPDGLLEYIYKVVQRMSYAVIVVAEGTAKSLLHPNVQTIEFSPPIDYNANNNAFYKDDDHTKDVYGFYDSGVSPSEWIKEELGKYFKAKKESATIRLISASTSCRSAPANPSDRVHCLSLSNNAVHAAMYGYTAFSSAIVNNRSVLIPASIISRDSPSALSLTGRTLERVRILSQQPSFTGYDEETKASARAFALAHSTTPPPVAKL